MKSSQHNERLRVTELTTMEEKRKKGDLITAFKFLNQPDDSDRQQFLKRCSTRVTGGNNKKLGKKLLRKDPKKFWFIVGRWMAGMN